MKALLILFLTTSALGQNIRPLRGLYTCLRGNNESICEQQLRPVFTGEVLTALSIEYVGWCGSMGPYLYPCSNNECHDAAILVKFHDETHYTWENRPHGMKCEFGPTF